MSTAQPITSIDIQKLCTFSSSCRTSSSMHRQVACRWSRRYRTIATNQEGASMEPNSRVSHNDTSKIPNLLEVPKWEIPLKESAKSPPSFRTPDWIKWSLGTLAWLSALPSWKKLQGVKGMVNKIDSVVEAIETVAEATEKTSSDFAGCLPDGGLKNVVLELEQASKIVVKDVQAIDTCIHKVEDKLKEAGEAKS